MIAAYVGALNMFQFMNNFIDVKKGTTSAMKEGVMDHIWMGGISEEFNSVVK